MIPALASSSQRYRAVDGSASQQIDDGSEDDEESSLVSHGLAAEGASSAHTSVARRPRLSSTDLSPIRLPRQREQNPPLSAFVSASPPFDVHFDSFHSFSREGSIPMKHPTPDLQAVQGAYVGNVERLEQHAERLSMGSDVGEELRKLKLEQKRTGSRQSSVRKSRQFSSNSQTNSILGLNTVARSGGFSHEGYVISPTSHSPIRSPSQSHASQFETRRPSDPSIYSNYAEDGPVQQSPTSYRSGKLSVRNEDPHLETHHEEQEPQPHEVEPEGSEYDKLYDAATDLVKRTASNASKTTFQQAEVAFAEFDGTHIHETMPPPLLEEPEPESEPDREDPSPQPLGSRKPTRSPGDLPPGMVYYPAPVPMMLNLPPKLSKGPSAAQIAQRKTRIMMDENKARRSAANLLVDEADGVGSTAGEPKLPPQLRATMFFDHDPIAQHVEIKDGSAVATLDSILDASAYAPVSAFTDHPIVGQMGKEVYGAAAPGPRKSRSTMMLNQNHDATRKSFLGFGRKSQVMDSELAAGNGAALQAGEDEDEEDDDAAPHQDDEFMDVDNTRPTTLLAELQMRKKQQQQRSKTAANAFPGGMRATLMQLDAVAQVHRDARKHKHVTLAWEDSAADEDGGEGDEDVPLAMLQRRKGGHSPQYDFDEDRPLGLLAQRQLDDNEPLSARRARLRGEPSAANPDHIRNNLPPPPPPGAAGEEEDEDEEEAGETLAQRRRRLKIQEAIPVARPVSGDFASELMSELGVPAEKPAAQAANGTAARGASPEQEEETLGQRRKRLQAERLGGRVASADAVPPVQDKRTSMAGLLQAYPTGQRAASGAAANQRHSAFPPIYPLQHSATLPAQPRRQSSFGTLAHIQDAYAAQHGSGSGYAYGQAHAVVYPLQHQPVYAAQPVQFQAQARQNPWMYGGMGMQEQPLQQQVFYPPPAMPQQMFYGAAQAPMAMPLQHHMQSSAAAMGMPGAIPQTEDARRAMVDRWRQSVV